MSDPLESLRARFRARVEGDLVRLQHLTAGDPASEDLGMLAHNIAGAAGMFGYPRLSAAAMIIDDCFAAGEVPHRDQIALLAECLREVVEAPDDQP